MRKRTKTEKCLKSLRRICEWSRGPGWLVAKRWNYLIFLAVVGAGLGVVVNRLGYASVNGSLVKALGEYNTATYIAVVAILLTVLVTMRRFGGLHFGQFHPRMILYPPAWSAGVAAFCIYLYVVSIDANQTAAGWDMLRWIGYGICALVFGAQVVVPFLHRVVAVVMGVSRFIRDIVGWRSCWNSDQKDIQRTQEWLRTESPIEDPNDDRFLMRTISRRLARLVLQRDKFPATALEGPYGSGKSSILNMVEFYIRNPARLAGDEKECRKQKLALFKGKNLLVARVDAWGTDAGSAPRLILDAAIRELRKHVDCTALAAMPVSYLHAMQASSSGPLGIAGALLGSDLNPRHVLKRMNDITAAAGLRLLIFIEDVDRDDPDEERQHAVNALLNGLHRLENISFIFTVGRGHMNALLIRLCEHIEIMPVLDRQSVENEIYEFAQRQLAEFVDIPVDIPGPDSIFDTDDAGDCLDVQVPTTCKSFGTPSYYSSMDADYARENSHVPLHALSRLLQTPRLLTNVLRYTMNLWHKLHGEISFEDILCVQALRVAEPDAYLLLAKHFESTRRRIRPLKAPPPSTGNLDEHNRDWSALQIDGRVSDHEAANALIDFVLPPLFTGKYEMAPECQRVCRPGFTDYWARLHAGDVDGISDQLVLRAVDTWEPNTTAKVYEGKTLIQCLTEVIDFRDKLEDFAETALLQAKLPAILDYVVGMTEDDVCGDAVMPGLLVQVQQWSSSQILDHYLEDRLSGTRSNRLIQPRAEVATAQIALMNDRVGLCRKSSRRWPSRCSPRLRVSAR
jgi:KAP family P-loop domain